MNPKNKRSRALVPQTWFVLPPVLVKADCEVLVRGITRWLESGPKIEGPLSLATMEIHAVRGTAALFTRGRGVGLLMLGRWLQWLGLQHARFAATPNLPLTEVPLCDLLRHFQALLPMLHIGDVAELEGAPVLMHFRDRAAAFRQCISKLACWMSQTSHGRLVEARVALHLALLAGLSYFLVLRGRRRSLLRGSTARWRVRRDPTEK